MATANTTQVIGDATTRDEWITYQAKVDFHENKVLWVERDGERIQVDHDLGGTFAEYRLGLGDPNAIERYRNIKVSEVDGEQSDAKIADFETGWNGFSTLINEKFERGTDATAERTTEYADYGDTAVRVAFGKNGGEGDVTVRRSDIDVSSAETLHISSNLLVQNSYGHPWIEIFDQDGEKVHEIDIRDQSQNEWRENTFDISGLDAIQIDFGASSGAGTEQEAVIDYIHT
jgi:hypothetical protein